MRIRVGAAAAGLAGLLGASLAATGLLATPSFGAPHAAAAAASPVPTATTTPTTPTTTGPTGTGSPATPGPGTPTTTTPCSTYAGPGTLPPGSLVRAYDFEDGTTQGWSGRDGASPVNTDAVAAGGSRSLRVGGLTSSNDIAATISQPPGFGWYKVTAKVRVQLPQPAVQIVLRAATNGGSTITGRARAMENGWSEVTAYFRPGTLYLDWICNGTLTGTQAPASSQIQLALDVVPPCGQVIDRPATVYLDDVVVTTATTGSALPTTPPPSSPCGSVTSPPPPQCLATYRVQSQWPGGYTAAVEVRNPTTTVRPTWSMTWSFPDDQKIDTMWGASFTQTGRQVTVTSPAWAPLQASGSVSFGFVGASQSAPGIPAALALDGQTCG